jgi:hypothetical protein
VLQKERTTHLHDFDNDTRTRYGKALLLVKAGGLLSDTVVIMAGATHSAPAGQFTQVSALEYPIWHLTIPTAPSASPAFDPPTHTVRSAPLHLSIKERLLFSHTISDLAFTNGCPSSSPVAQTHPSTTDCTSTNRFEVVCRVFFSLGTFLLPPTHARTVTDRATTTRNELDSFWSHRPTRGTWAMATT